MLHCPRMTTRTIAYSGIFLAIGLTSALAADPTGDWKVADGVATIRVAQCYGNIWGAVAWEKTPGGKDTHNPDASKQSRPTLGMGQVPGPVLLVQNVGDVAALTLPGDTPVAYITQTTLSVDDTKDIIAALQARLTDIQGPDIRDICYATQNRQSAVRDLSKLVDVILVVGAANSSNSNRLREIGTEVGVASYLIADGSELNPDWLSDAKAVGITAGASAPEVLVDDVIEALRRIGPVRASVLPGRAAPRP